MWEGLPAIFDVSGPRLQSKQNARARCSGAHGCLWGLNLGGVSQAQPQVVPLPADSGTV